MHLFRFARPDLTCRRIRGVPDRFDGGIDNANALESFLVKPAYFQGTYPTSGGFPAPLYVKSLTRPVLVAGTKYRVRLTAPQSVRWRTSNEPMRGLYVNPSPHIERDETVAQPGAFTVSIDAFPLPVVQNDSAVVGIDHSISIDVLANDSPATGQTLAPASLKFATAPAHGTAAVNPANGVVLYQPASGFTGTDRFTYTIRDQLGALSSAATVSIRVQPAPSVSNDSGTLSAGQTLTIDVLANDSSSGGSLDPASIVVNAAALHGSAVVSNGKIGYTPQAGFSGTDAFSYSVRDNLGTVSGLATVNLTVRALPVAANDTATVRAGESVIIDVLANDASPGGTVDAASIQVSTAPAHGTTTVANGKITYAPTAGYSGQDTFQYTVANDRAARSNAATVSIDVSAPPSGGGSGGGTSGGGTGASSGGGGGAIGVTEVLGLCGLAGLALRRRVRRAA